MSDHLRQHHSGRAATRTATQAGIVCRRFSSSGERCMVNGELLNYSEDGSYVVMSKAYPPGSVLVVRLVSYPQQGHAGSGASGLRSIFLAEVKWQRRIKDASACRFGMGLRYLG